MSKVTGKDPNHQCKLEQKRFETRQNSGVLSKEKLRVLMEESKETEGQREIKDFIK